MLTRILRALAMRRRQYVYRSSIDGKFVSKEWAEAHPNISVRERVK